MISRFLISALIGIGLSSAARAQSLTAPAGIPAVTAPGGVQGRAAAPNQRAAPDRRVGVVDAGDRPQSTGWIVPPSELGRAR